MYCLVFYCVVFFLYLIPLLFIFLPLYFLNHLVAFQRLETQVGPLGYPTIAPTLCSAGVGINIIPPMSSLSIDRRGMELSLSLSPHTHLPSPLLSLSLFIYMVLIHPLFKHSFIHILLIDTFIYLLPPRSGSRRKCRQSDCSSDRAGCRERGTAWLNSSCENNTSF